MSLISGQRVRALLQPLANEFEFYRALMQDISGLVVSANNTQTKADPLPYSRGIVITGVRDGVVYEASTPYLTTAGITKLVQGLIHSSQQYQLPGQGLSFEQETPLEKVFQGPDGKDIPLSEKVTKVRSIVEHLSNSDRAIVMASARFKQTKIHETYISEKRLLEQKISRFEAFFSIILKDDETGNSASMYDGFALQGGWEQMNAPEPMLRKMLVDAKKILNAKRLPPGSYDCVFSPSLSGILAHEAFGHGTEGDTMLKGRARGSAYVNKPVAAPGVCLYDSPALQQVAASYFFDHEGCLAQETRIVEGGVLTNPMTDHRSASALKVKRSPNGRRESYSHKVYTRMTNTYFMPGKHKVDELVSSVQDGFFVDRATNGMEDPKSWGIQLEALYAERIKNGKLTGEVFSPVIVTGYVPDILMSITMASDSMHINGLGMCGKGYKEWVKVTDGGPYLKLKARLA